MKNKNLIFIEHILDSIVKIEQFIGDYNQNEFNDNIQLQDAVVRRIEIIGEATKNLSKGFTTKYLDIPWKEIVGVRDRIIHRYFGVDLEIIWEIIKKDLPDLKTKLIKIKKGILDEQQI
jgi:uncharacterized protein with HEPN domain